MKRILLENPEVVMTTLTTAQEGRRTFILSMAASLALLSTVGLMTTLSDASRPAPAMADRSPPGVRDAVILTAAQYEALQDQPVVTLAATEPEAKPASATIAKATAPAPAKPIKTALALAADTQAKNAADIAPLHPIKMSLAMAPETAEAAAVR
jgi:hypothetical protein